MQNKSLVARKRVLVVGCAGEALRLADWLAADGYEVVIAGDMEPLLDLLHDIEPDAILLDLHIPGMPGLLVLRIIQAIHPHIPVVTMTVASSHDMALLSLEAGARAYLLKPFQFQQLRKLLDSQIEEVRACESRYGMFRRAQRTAPLSAGASALS